MTRKSDAPIAADTAAVGELAKIAGKLLDQRTAPAPANGLTEATTQLILGVAQGRDQLAAKLAELAPGTDSLQSLDRAVELLKKLQPASNPTDGLATVDRVLSIMEKLNTTRPKAEAQDPLDYVEKILSVADRLRPVQSPSATGTGDGGNLAAAIARRSRMSGWQELIQPAIPVVVDFLKPFAAQLATSLFTRAGQPAPAAVNGQATQTPSPAVPQGQPQNGALPPLLNMIAGPMLNYMRVDADPHELGEDFASWVHEGFQADARFNSAIAMARAAGPNMVIVQFKSSAWWLDRGPNGDKPSLSELEGKFAIFIQAFLNWQPQQEGTESDAPEVIDIG